MPGVSSISPSRTAETRVIDEGFPHIGSSALRWAWIANRRRLVFGGGRAMPVLSINAVQRSIQRRIAADQAGVYARMWDMTAGTMLEKDAGAVT